MELAHLVAAVVVLRLRQISIAPFGLAPRRVRRRRRARFGGPGTAVQPHEIVLGGREVGAASQVEPNSGAHKVHGPTDILGFRHQHEPGARPGPAVGVMGEGVEGEHGRGRRGLGLGRRVVGWGGAVEGPWVEESVVVGLRAEVVVREVDGVVCVCVCVCGVVGGGCGRPGPMQEVVGQQGVRGVVVEDLAVGLVGGRGGAAVFVSRKHYG